MSDMNRDKRVLRLAQVDGERRVLRSTQDDNGVRP